MPLLMELAEQEREVKLQQPEEELGQNSTHVINRPVSAEKTFPPHPLQETIRVHCHSWIT